EGTCPRLIVSRFGLGHGTVFGMNFGNAGEGVARHSAGLERTCSMVTPGSRLGLLSVACLAAGLGMARVVGRHTGREGHARASSFHDSDLGMAPDSDLGMAPEFGLGHDETYGCWSGEDRFEFQAFADDGQLSVVG
ncbi:MAG: hypothetical protein ACPGXK_09565, partial [Phycisphaerae bacterium]